MRTGISISVTTADLDRLRAVVRDRNAPQKRGVFRSVADLQAAINRFLDDHNAHSSPSNGSPIPPKSSPP